MTTPDEIADRLDRARRQSFTVEHGSESKLLEDPPVTITRTTSGDVYTLVPEQAYCSCPDHEHREVPCKHLLALALDEVDTPLPSERRERLVEAIESEADRWVSIREERQQALSEARQQSRLWTSAVEELEDATESRDTIARIASTASLATE